MAQNLKITDTIEKLRKLPEDKAKSAQLYIDFLFTQLEEEILSESLAKLSESSLSFLNDEPNVYTVDDVKEKYVYEQR